MRTLRRLPRWFWIGLIVGLICSLASLPARAGWGAGCGAGSAPTFAFRPALALAPLPAMPAAEAARYEWRCDPASPNFGLFRDGVQIGAWTPIGGYQAILGPGVWSEARESPCELPGIIRTPQKRPEPAPAAVPAEPDRTPVIQASIRGQAPAKKGGCPCTGEPECHCPPGCDCPAAVKNYGVITERQRDPAEGEKIILNGREASRKEAVEAIRQAGPGVPDDSAKLSFTVISGDKALRERIAADMNAPGMKDLKDRVIEKYYDPNGPERPLLAPGFVTSEPTIYLQAPDGKVLARASAYNAQTLEGLRKQLPDYKPAVDPDPNAPSIIPADLPPLAVPLGALGALGLGAAAVKSRKR